MIEKETKSEALQVEHRLKNEVRTLEHWYSTEFERRLTELAGVLNTQLEARVEQVRAHYQEQYRNLQEEARQAPVPAPLTTSSPTPAGPSTELIEELARVEASAQKCAADLERMVADDNIPMGQLLQLRNQEVELKAYIRGLKFNATTLTSAARPADATK
jgi:hypothetical protein